MINNINTMEPMNETGKILSKITEGDFIKEDIVNQFKEKEHIALLTFFNGGACISLFYGREDDFNKYRPYFDIPSGIEATDTYLEFRQFLLDVDYIPINKSKMQEFIKQSENGEINVVATVFFEYYKPENGNGFFEFTF